MKLLRWVKGRFYRALGYGNLTPTALAYLRRLLQDEEGRLADLRSRTVTYETLAIDIGYHTGRVEAYKEIIGFLSESPKEPERRSDP